MNENKFDLITDYYINRFAELIHQLIAGVLGVGIFLVAYNYGRIIFSYNEYEIIKLPDFWIRIILLITVIAFVIYDLIAYKIHIEIQSKITPANINQEIKINANKPIILFIVEIIRLILSAWIFASTAISELGKKELIGLNIEQKTDLIGKTLEVDIKLYVILFLFLSLWHLTMLIWYLIDNYRSFWNLKFHLIGIAINVLMMIVSLLISENIYAAYKLIVQVVLTSILVIYVVWIYKGRFYQFVQEDIKMYKN